MARVDVSFFLARFCFDATGRRPHHHVTYVVLGAGADDRLSP